MAAELLKNFTESFFSKIGEKLVDYGLEKVTEKKDSKFMLETLQRGLNSLSDKACDIKEQIEHGEQSRKKKRKREVHNWLEEVQKIEIDLRELLNKVQEEGFLGRFFGGGQVSELNARVSELVDQSHHFGELLLDSNEVKGEPLLTPQLVGAFDKNIEVIWKWLVIDKVKSIGIYGMGGVGKTTLAKHINNRLLEEPQCSVYWVVVSQDFTINKLQSDIAKVIGLDFLGEDNGDKRAGRLNQALSQRKDFVLILDDVWNDIDLEKMGDPLGIEGCRLIITTRSLTVCHKIDCQQIIKVETLHTDESWTLFRETLGKRTTISSEVEEIAKSMAKECDGLPLGIIVLAKSMKGVTDIREWRNAFNEIRESPIEQGDMEEKVFRVLAYSFNRLDPEFHGKRRNAYTTLQLSFLYCSLYPEDWKINKDELIRKFISEDLVDKKKSLEKQLDQGYTMLSKLVRLCLLEHHDDDRFGESFEAVVMHDLLRDMALKIARESPKYKVFAGLGLKKIPNEEEWTENVDKISLMSNEIEEILPGMAPNCPRLATLILNDNPLMSIPESFFAQISSLHFLDLSRTRVSELPNSLFDLESLNTLLLNKCGDLVSVPYLGKLKALRELDLSWTSIKEMPKGMENMINLQILLFRGTKNLKLQPGDLSLISPYLQHLELPFQIKVLVNEIERFKQLKIFVGRFENVSDFNQFQSQTGALISKFYYAMRTSDNFNDENELFRFKNTFTIYGFSLRRGEGKDGMIILPGNIQKLQIIYCIGQNSCLLDYFKSSPCFLEELKIDDCKRIESIWNINNDQLMAEREIKVKFISLYGLQDLKGLVNWEVGGVPLPCPPPQAATLFSSLQRLSIWNCKKMKTLGLPLPYLHNIRIIDVQYCDEIEELIELVEVAEDDEKISEPTHSLPNLERLTLFDLPKLKSICKARINCKSIQEIWLHRCPKVKKLPLFHPSSERKVSPPPDLIRIDIEKERWESLEWDDPTHKHLLQPFVEFEFPEIWKSSSS